MDREIVKVSPTTLEDNRLDMLDLMTSWSPPAGMFLCTLDAVSSYTFSVQHTLYGTLRSLVPKNRQIPILKELGT